VLGQGTEDEFLERFRHDLPQDDQQMLIFGTSRGSSRIWGCRAAVAGGVLLVNSRYLAAMRPLLYSLSLPSITRPATRWRAKTLYWRPLNTSSHVSERAMAPLRPLERFGRAPNAYFCEGVQEKSSPRSRRRMM